ncbi:MATE family efflux transporter [Bifidobacterium sp. ESL0763]|uniref:MATE family efflux transporter n=1 Tax=Bifidobacterium sp. ESL0763 TaxID=2983227 RepID=UPI0023F9AEA7|nr:MATE family efflux transporter [Bifidobacterium sp. ESL0763]MDF7664420.1 MATE family efflux transporter [Bifidobacterium sp. ESL0763]
MTTDAPQRTPDDEATGPAGAIDAAERHRINRQILALAIPTFGQLIADPLFVLIDTAIVGHIGDTALAGLSIGSTVLLTVAGLCNFLAYGTTSRVGQLMGAGRKREGLETGVDGLWLALIIGLAISAAFYAFATPLCRLMGASGEVLANAVVYLRAVIFGLPGMLLVYAANGIFRGLKKVRITLVAAVLGAALNTALDFLFVFGMNLGIMGSGLATLVAQWFMGIYLVVPSLKWAHDAGASLAPRLSGITGTAADGLPLFIRTLALRICLVATVVLATHMGTEVLAGYQAVNSSWNFVLNMLDAIGISGQALIATEIGAKRYGRAREMTRISAKAGFYGGIGIAVALIVFGIFAAPMFSPNPAIQHLIVIGTIVVAIFLPLAGWMWALDGILIGAGDYRYLAITCSAVTVVYLPLVLALNFIDNAFDPSATVRMVLLWAVFNVVFIGGRSLFNGLRARGDKWMRK